MGEVAIIIAKSIVTKPVKAYTKVSGVPARLFGEVVKKNQGGNGNGGGAGGAILMEGEGGEVRVAIERLVRKHSRLLMHDDEEDSEDGAGI